MYTRTHLICVSISLFRQPGRACAADPPAGLWAEKVTAFPTVSMTLAWALKSEYVKVMDVGGWQT